MTQALTEMAAGALRSGPLSAQDHSAIAALLATYQFHEYRHVSTFAPEAIRRYLLAQVAQALNDATCAVLGAWRHNQLVGLVHARPAAWDSAHYGMRIYELCSLITSGPRAQRQVGAECLLTALPAALPADVACLTHLVDVEDYPVIHALERSGYRLVKTSLSYVFLRRTIGNARVAGQGRYRVRPAGPGDTAAMIHVAEHIQFNGRFYNDPDMPDSRVDEMYVSWIRECCEERPKRFALVAEAAGRVVGFIVFRCLEEFEQATGISIAGCGMLGVMPGHAGAGVALFHGASVHGGPAAAYGQFDVGLMNPAMLRLCGAFGLRVAHARHVFHAWPVRGSRVR